jgi:hypothetical protein
MPSQVGPESSHGGRYQAGRKEAKVVVLEGEADLDFEGDFGSVTTSDVARASVTLSPSSGAVITSHSAGLGGRGAGEGSRP